MKLKHKWPAIIIWVMFVIFNVIMVAGSGYSSGLLPAGDTLLYTIAFTALGVAFMNVVTFFLGNLCDSLELYRGSGKKAGKVIYTVVMALIVIGAYVVRFLYLANSTAPISGQKSLYENAVIGGTNKVADSGLLSIVYSKILSGVLLFTGNRISMAYIFSAVLSCFFIILSAAAIKLLLGYVAAIVYAAFVAFMPAFSQSFMNLELTTEPLFLVMFGIELLFVALYLRRASDGNFRGAKWIPWYLIVGIVIGFMGYVDGGTFVVVLPLLLAALYVINSSFVTELGRLLFVVLGAVVSFAAMIFQEGGASQFVTVLGHWASYYFHNVGTFDTFWTFTDFKVAYIATVIAMSGVIVGFWKNRRIDKVSPWLLSIVVLFAMTPLFGETRINSQLMITVFFGFILACVAALIVMEPTDVIDDEEDEEEFIEEEEVSDPEERIVRPQRTEEFNDAPEVDDETPADGEPEFADSEADDEQEDELAPEDEDALEAEAPAVDEPAPEVDEDSEPEASEDSEPAEPETPEAPADSEAPETAPEVPEAEAAAATAPETTAAEAERFVPEGMVLPMETEADSEAAKRERPKRKVREFEGKIALNRRDRNGHGRRGRDYKKEFDIQIKPGDDFDF
ncbi:MAG: hypothetical protein IKZ97_01130 [Butyrivibrio sp.]|nr:hypothetical protein [Butyrivibrio sp.]